MNEKFIEGLDMSTWRAQRDGRDIELLSPTVLGALVQFGGILRIFASHSPIVAAYFHQFEAITNQVHEAIRRLLIDRLFDGKLSDEQAKEAVAILKRDADSGL